MVSLMVMWLFVTNVCLVLINFGTNVFSFCCYCEVFTQCDIGYTYDLNVNFET